MGSVVYTSSLDEVSDRADLNDLPEHGIDSVHVTQDTLPLGRE